MPPRGRGLRIVAGVCGGQRIEVSAGTRPTIDRVRAAMFDSLGQAPPDRVLDCYAGSGALGLEALSRGSEFVRFIDSSGRAISAIEANLQRLGLETSARVDRANVLRADLALGGPFGLVFADPPYASDPWPCLMEILTQPKVITADGGIVAEFSSRRLPPDPPSGWFISKTRRHGDSTFAIYRGDHAIRTSLS